MAESPEMSFASLAVEFDEAVRVRERSLESWWFRIAPVLSWIGLLALTGGVVVGLIFLGLTGARA